MNKRAKGCLWISGGVALLFLIALVIPMSDTERTPPVDRSEALDRRETAKSVPAVKPAATPQPTSEATPSWETLTFTDEWGEPAGKGAGSRWVMPARELSFPYGRARARLMVQDCDTTYIRFTESPNLVGGDISDGYTTYPVRARWGGGDVFRASARQKWGGKDLVLTSAITVGMIADNESLSVATDWYGESSTVWRFALDGSRRALMEAGCLQQLPAWRQPNPAP